MKIDDLNAAMDAIEKELTKTKEDSNRANIKANNEEQKLATPAQRDGQTRSTLTIWFLCGFFGLLVFSFIFVMWYNSYLVDWVLKLKNAGLENASEYLKPLELDKVLSVIITALGTSLGFIIGYYFKEKQSGA